MKGPGTLLSYPAKHLDDIGHDCGSNLHVDSKNGIFLLRKLADAKRAAFRRRVWFRVLSRVDRAIVDLTIRCVDDVKSQRLAKVLMAIMEKLQLAMECIVDRMVRYFGSAQARKVSEIGVLLGHPSAKKWAVDIKFARFLAVMHADSTGYGLDKV